MAPPAFSKCKDHDYMALSRYGGLVGPMDEYVVYECTRCGYSYEEDNPHYIGEDEI